MAINQETFNTDLYKLLRTRGYKPVPKDVKNQRTQPEEAEVFNFTFTKDGKDYGDAWVTIDEAQNVVLYYSNEQEESPSGKSPNLDYDDSWSGLKRHLKQWSMNKQLSFELRNKDELGDDMAQRDYVKKKEKMNEGYHSMGKKASYNDNIPAVKIILQHNRQIEEGEQRYRNIAKIFLENQDGERFLAPTTRPGIAQVYARHIAEGGVPNDERWNHIKSICEEYSKMAGFVRATKNKQFNESAQSLVNEGINHYQSLRETLGKLRGHRGYNTYFESWTPALMEDDTDGTQINELFVQETVDPRIESVMPILSRLHKKIGETPVKEVSELEQWADSIVEGETLNELGDSDEDKLSPTERNEQKERDKKEYDKNLKKTPDAIKKKLNLPDNIDEGQSNDKESTREKIKSLQATLKSVKGNYPGDDRNRQLIRSEIFDLKQKLKNKSDLSEDSGSDFIHLPPDIFLLHTHKAPRNHVQLWNNWWQRNGFTADEKTNLLRKGNDLYRFNYDEKGLEKVKTDLSEETLEEDSDSNPVESAIIRRIINVRTELLGKHGPEKVLDAVKEVASYVGDVDEIGSSDVSGWIRQVERILSSQDEDDFDADFVYGKSEPVDNVDSNDFGDFGDDPRDEDDSKFSNESLDKNQKKAGQLGPTEKVGPKGAVGKLVGANESVDVNEGPIELIQRGLQFGAEKVGQAVTGADELTGAVAFVYNNRGILNFLNDHQIPLIVLATILVATSVHGTLDLFKKGKQAIIKKYHEIKGTVDPNKVKEVEKQIKDAENKINESKKIKKEGQEDLDLIKRLIK